jgi:hypothetical protein
MTPKHAPATPLTPFQQFYDTPTPSIAIKLALADSFVYCAPMMPDGVYIKMLHKAEERCDAYPQLVAALRTLQARIDACELGPVNAGRELADAIADECVAAWDLLAKLEA